MTAHVQPCVLGPHNGDRRRGGEGGRGRSRRGRGRKGNTVGKNFRLVKILEYFFCKNLHFFRLFFIFFFYKYSTKVARSSAILDVNVQKEFIMF